MNPIPPKMREELAEDPRMQKCVLLGTGECAGEIQYHHPWIYAGRQINEKWAIVAGCKHHHELVDSDPEVKKAFAIASLSLATDEDLIKYPNVNWNQIKKTLGLARQIKSSKKTSDPIVQVVAEITKIETMTDGLKMTVRTNEVAPDEMAILMTLKNKQGNMLFAPASHQFSDADIQDLPEVKAEFKGQPSPSERLRNVLYVYFTKMGGKPQNFEPFRVKQMETFIQQIKDKIPE